MQLEKLHEILIQDLLPGALVQIEGEKACKLLLRAPHREIRAEDQPVGADLVDEAQNDVPVGHAERGGRVVQHAFRLRMGQRLRPDVPAAEMRGHDLQIRHAPQQIRQPLG